MQNQLILEKTRDKEVPRKEADQENNNKKRPQIKILHATHEHVLSHKFTSSTLTNILIGLHKKEKTTFIWQLKQISIDKKTYIRNTLTALSTNAYQSTENNKNNNINIVWIPFSYFRRNVISYY